jgi:IS30 family transposase
MNCTHLTREERYRIFALKKAGHKQNGIAIVLERSESTISRELARNRGQRVHADKRAGGLMWKNLRCQKQRRKRYGKMDRRGIIPARLPIEDRPAIVDERKGSATGKLIPSSARATGKPSRASSNARRDSR